MFVKRNFYISIRNLHALTLFLIMPCLFLRKSIVTYTTAILHIYVCNIQARYIVDGYPLSVIS